MVVFGVMMITATIIESVIHGPQSLLLSFVSGYSGHNHNNKNDSNFTCYNLFHYLQSHKNKCLTQSTIIKRNLSMIKTKTKMTNYHQKKQNKTKQKSLKSTRDTNVNVYCVVLTVCFKCHQDNKYDNHHTP